MELSFLPIGTAFTPFKELISMPVQPAAARGAKGTIEIRDDLRPGLNDLDGFSHIIVLYCFHKVTETRLTVTPFLDSSPHGVFATRAPTRPNPIGLSVLRVCSVNGTTIEVEDVDILDGTPVLDIKPFVPSFDMPTGQVKVGWLGKTSLDLDSARSDHRFIDSKQV